MQIKKIGSVTKYHKIVIEHTYKLNNGKEVKITETKEADSIFDDYEQDFEVERGELTDAEFEAVDDMAGWFDLSDMEVGEEKPIPAHYLDITNHHADDCTCADCSAIS